MSKPKALENTINKAFDEIAWQFADKVAISDSNQQLTYAEIMRISDNCAFLILQIQKHHSLSVSPVIISLKNDIRLYALFLGVMKTGRPYFYIDPDDLQEIKTKLANKIAANIVIGEAIVSSSIMHYLDPEEIFNNTKKHFDLLPWVGSDIQKPCCLVQTSATTREARAVAIRHQALAHHISHFQKTLKITSADRIGLLSLPQFSASTAAIYGALLAGASFSPFLVKSKGLDGFIAWIQHENINILHLTPSLFRKLVTYANKLNLNGIRAIKVGGEPLYRSDVDLFNKKFSEHCILVNGLGMSELGGNVSHYVVDKHSVIPGFLETLPVGKVLSGHQIIIVDAQKKPLPHGELGEVVLRSSFIADGYWNATGAENDAFKVVDHSTHEVEFYTNDLGYLLTDGVLVHSGRKNRMIKRHGYRVDLNMIEAALLSIAAINQAAAYFTPLATKANQLFVCIQLIDQQQNNSDRILNELKTVLPEYMVPQSIYVLDSFPLTSSGKIDHRAVLNEITKRHLDREIVNPRVPLEKKLVQIWQEIFQLNEISIYDNFFELGGNSLSAIEFCTRLERELQLSYLVEKLINNPTIGQIVEDITSRQLLSNYKSVPKPLTASIFPLRISKDRSHQSLVFLSGGAMSEKEILLIAGLLPYLTSEFAVYATHLNLVNNAQDFCLSINDLTDIMVTALIKMNLPCKPVLIGECIACILTIQVAEKLSHQLQTPIDVLLLNPWHPRTVDSTQSVDNEQLKEKYLQLLKQAPQPSYANPITIFLPQAHENSQDNYIQWWSKKMGVSCVMKLVPGNSSSYIRDHRAHLSTAINAFCETIL